jgi:hypothetical protein
MTRFFVLKTYLALNNILVKGNIPARCGKYYWVGCDIDPHKLSGIRDYSLQAASDGMPMPFPPVWNEKPIWEAKLAASESRPDFQRLDELIHTLENDFEASVNVFQRSLKIPTSGSGFLTPIPSWWDTIDRVIKTYLKLRVCDLVKYGWRIADWTYPQPKVPDVANEDVERLVTALKTKFHRAEVSRRQEEEKAYLDIRKNFYIPEAVNNFIISRDHDIKKCGYWPYVVNDKNIIYLPKYTPLRVLTAPEREDLKQACLQEILGYEGGYFGRRMIEALEEFVEFLELLTHPDNQVRTLSAQYKEIRVPSRSRRDMWDEMAEELSRLPFYTAYVKVLQLGSEQSGFIQKMRTVALPPLPQGTTEKLRVDLRRKFAVDRTHVRYCRERGAIEEEIRQRQERWRRPEGRKTAAQRPSNRASRPVSPPGFPDPQQGSEEPPPPTRS